MAHELRVKPYTLCSACYDKPDVDAVIAEKDAKILHLKAEVMRQKHHADVFMDERNAAEKAVRNLTRARWLDKAARANAEWGHWATIWFCDTGAILNINKSSVSQDPYRCTITRNAAEWRNLWAEVERKCRAMAERFKD